MVAMPSQTAMLFRQHGEKRQTMQSANLKQLLTKYGGESHMNLPDHVKAASKMEPETGEQVAANATELTGLIGIRTKFTEDVFLGNHSAVWGSFFCTETKKWGYKCCKLTTKTALKCPVAAAQKAPILKVPAAASQTVISTTD